MSGDTRTYSTTGFLVRRFTNASTWFRGSILAALLIVTSGLAGCHRTGASHAAAADQPSISKPNPNACNANDDDVDGLNSDPSTNVHAERDYAATVSRMLKEEKFETLDCLADRTRSNKERFPGGTWKLHELYKGLYEPVQYPVTHPTDDDWDELLRQLRHWVALRPKSVTARIALASAYIGYAKDARGEGDASTVSEGGWKLFRERTAAAERILKEASTLHTKCPEWYIAMQGVARNQNWDAARKRKLFEKAYKFDPGYYYSAGMFASDLLPKQGGKPGDTETFLQQLADHIGGDRGDIFYYQVANTPGLLCNCDEDPHLSWQRIKRGFEASEKQYGISLLNLNRLAFLAAHYGRLDPIFAEKAFSRIGEHLNEETWEREEDFESAKQWAVRWAPAMAKEQTWQAEAEANLRTPQGSRYSAAFERKLGELLQQCIRIQGPSMGIIETLTSVGANGTVENATVHGPGGVCVYQKLLSLQGDRTTLFPPPPQAPYWVKLDLDWANFTSAPTK